MQEQEIVYDPEYVYFQIERTYTNYVNRILEGYEYVGVMTTVNAEGLCMVRTTESTRELAKEILQSLPISVTLLE
ncbi:MULTISPECIES: DUF4911 domain-containing protein [unclassified Veillonella]|jgi:hypothetical protein|uniref:DUF4911 domain-containing protein n=1 Tax=unclassified Veillonella TaxID=2630086 RepID=UPI00078467A9|nr:MULTISPECIES: DUF4911 domain-containing protein [unclassified Veillonella]KXB89303.1 hypothetical protein HMPREF3032_00314 [Veillonella sp. DNF00869]